MSDLFCIRDEVEKSGGKQVDADVGGLIVGQQQRQGREFIPTQKNLKKTFNKFSHFKLLILMKISFF